MIVIKRDGSLFPWSAIANRGLSYKATGLLVYVLTEPEPEELTFSDLCELKTDGRDSVLNGLSELNEAGYLLYLRWRNNQGRWESEYIFFETRELKDKYLQTLSEEEKQRISTISKPGRGGAI